MLMEKKGKSVGDDDVCVCVEPSLSVEASTVKEKSAICVEIHDMSSDRYFYPDICPVHDYEEYSSHSELFAALYESLVCFFKQRQVCRAGRLRQQVNHLRVLMRIWRSL